MFESSMESMVDLMPVAMAGGIALGFTKEAMKIPGQIERGRSERPETPAERRRRKKKEEAGMGSTLWGAPPPGLM